VWVDNKYHMKSLLGMTASISSNAEVRTATATALADNPDLLPLMLHAIAQWAEHLDSRTWQRKGIGTTLEVLPPWFPTDEIVAEIKKQMVDLQPAHDEDGDEQLDEAHRLASLVLRLAQQERSDS
jgi:hypothetical protein